MSPINPIAIAVLCVLGAVIITLAFLPLMTKSSSYVAPKKRTSWAPPFDPGNLPSTTPSNPVVCLPGTLGYNGLVTCTRQTDCASCIDNKTLECVTINNTNNQIVDSNTKTLNPPVPVHLYKKANGICSGRGTQMPCTDPGAPENCNDYWCDCGKDYTSANNDPTNCDVQVLQVTEPGSYCLPSYVNACDPFTSETVLSNVGNGSEWFCECKYPQLFAQNNEGSNCSVPIACGAQEPQYVGPNVVKVMSYESNSQFPDSSCIAVNGSTNTQWKLCDSYPNQLVSSDGSHTVACTVPTVSNQVTIDTKIPNDKNYHYQEIKVSPLADPNCHIQPFTNTCTVQTAFDKNSNLLATQVLRGTGLKNDPVLTRLWPPYPDILPIGMQACPDNWSGDGTEANPCDDKQGFKIAYLDTYNQWSGKYLSLQDLRNQGYSKDSAVTCAVDGDCTSPQICAPAGVCVTPCTGGECTDGSTCKNGVCTTVTDDSCNISISTPAIGIPGTLGSIAWKTVNTGCASSPQCLEQSNFNLQNVKRDWNTTNDNIFPVTADNIGNSLCAINVQAPSCTCNIALQKIQCKKDTDPACNPSVSPKTCSVPSDCPSNVCDNGQCSTSCKNNVCLLVPAFPNTCSVPSDCFSKVCDNGQCSTACTEDSQCNVNQGEFCKENVCTAGLCGCGVDGCSYTCSDPPTTQLCTAATGYQISQYEGALDGPIVTDDGSALGGMCACNGFITNEKGQHVPLVSGALLDPSLAWTCVPDPCFVSGSNSYYNPDTKQCVCGQDASGASYYSWNTNNGVPTCQRDPCNPNGQTSTIQVSCSSDEQCSSDLTTCGADNLCYIWTGKACDIKSGTQDCIEGISGGQSVQCLQANDSNYYCAVQDSTRPKCSQTSDCALGICNKRTSLCTGGCICGGNTDSYQTDANPLHSACTDPCVFSPCGANGTCQSNATDGTYTCNCNKPEWSGDSCELRNCLPTTSSCTSGDQCCSNSCSYYFLQGHLCD